MDGRIPRTPENVDMEYQDYVILIDGDTLCNMLEESYEKHNQ